MSTATSVAPPVKEQHPSAEHWSSLPPSSVAPFLSTPPSIAPSAFVAPSAVILGDVTLAAGASVWYNCTLRGDVNRIVLGAHSNVQDNTVLHVSSKFPTIIGSNVTVGHSCTVHACQLGDNTLVGMGATVMDDAVIGRDCIVAAGSLVTKGKRFADGSLIQGRPATAVRQLTEKEKEYTRQNAAKYVQLAKAHRQHHTQQRMRQQEQKPGAS